MALPGQRTPAPRQSGPGRPHTVSMHRAKHQAASAPVWHTESAGPAGPDSHRAGLASLPCLHGSAPRISLSQLHGRRHLCIRQAPICQAPDKPGRPVAILHRERKSIRFGRTVHWQQDICPDVSMPIPGRQDGTCAATDSPAPAFRGETRAIRPSLLPHFNARQMLQGLDQGMIAFGRQAPGLQRAVEIENLGCNR